MDAYTYKCQGCGAALEYDIKTNLLVCNNCWQMYPITDYDLEKEDLINGLPGEGEAALDSTHLDMTKEGDDPEYSLPEEDYMQVNVYHCASCGGEIMTNDVEVSTFCSYCGQPSVIFDRISKERKPKKIFPFKITKEKALDTAKALFASGKLLKGKPEDVTVDSVHAIYMPYWLFDYKVSAEISGVIRTDKGHSRSFDLKEADEGVITLDASERFSNYASEKLNPFPLHHLEDFSPVYLTGFYADRFDVASGIRAKDLGDIIIEKLVDKALAKVPGAPDRFTRDMYGDVYRKLGGVDYRVDNTETIVNESTYIFCPIYFITFFSSGERILLLVNGETGKLVGTIPVDENKVLQKKKNDKIVYSVIFGIMGAAVFRFLPIVFGAVLFPIIISIFVLPGKKKKQLYNELRLKTNSEAMYDITNRDR